MPRTWEQVKLGIDVKNEAIDSLKHKQNIQKMQQDEADAASTYKLGLTLLAYPFLGPLAPAVGSIAGDYIADAQYDWESLELDPGKFYKTEDLEWQADMEEMAGDQTMAQLINSATSLASSFVSAGVFDEQFRGDWSDWTSFGTGGAEGGEWRLFDIGDPGTRTATGEVAKVFEPKMGSENYYHDLLLEHGSGQQIAESTMVEVPFMEFTPPSENYMPGVLQWGDKWYNPNLKENIGTLGGLLNWWGADKDDDKEDK